MKHIILVLVGASFVGAIALVKHARASDSAPPSSMDVATALRLDRDMSRIREYQAQIAAIQREIKPYGEEADAILSAHKIDLKSFLDGATVVDFKTGAITRPAHKVASR